MTTVDQAPGAGAPTADWVDPREMLRDPYETYRRLREMGPVVRAPALDRYMVTSYSGCRTIEADQETFTADSKSALTGRTLGGTPMLRKDDPEHAAERAPINRSLRPKSIREAWAPLFERNARLCLDALRDVGSEEADLNRDFAVPSPR